MPQLGEWRNVPVRVAGSHVRALQEDRFDLGWGCGDRVASVAGLAGLAGGARYAIGSCSRGTGQSALVDAGISAVYARQSVETEKMCRRKKIKSNDDRRGTRFFPDVPVAFGQQWANERVADEGK